MEIRDILTGEAAKAKFEELMKDSIEPNSVSVYQERLDENRIGGVWKDGKLWIAFDNWTHNCNVEEFSSEEEAVKFAKGITATTIDGTII